ncbi:MAG: ABC transporter permease, partial [Micromonosporaceae bacterium]
MAEATRPRRPGAGRWNAYRHLLAAQVRSQTQYRASFLTDLASSVVFGLLDLAGVMVMFLVTPALGGFVPVEVLLMAGLALTGFAVADLVVGNVERLRVYVRTGLLDAVLIRPLGVLPQLLALDVAPRRVGRLLQALVILAAALLLAEIPWTPWRVLVAVTTPLVGAAFFGALFVAGATVAFWWIESGELANAVTYGGKDFTTTPVTVYSGWFRA